MLARYVLEVVEDLVWSAVIGIGVFGVVFEGNVLIVDFVNQKCAAGEDVFEDVRVTAFGNFDIRKRNGLRSAAKVVSFDNSLLGED